MSRSRRRGKDTTQRNPDSNKKEQVVRPKEKFILFPPFVQKVPSPPKKEIKVTFEDVEFPVCGEEKFIVDLRKKYIVSCKDICTVCEDVLQKKLSAYPNIFDR